MGDIVEFVSKYDRARIRLLQEARARYDSVFPSYPSDGHLQIKRFATVMLTTTEVFDDHDHRWPLQPLLTGKL
jgi:hypothetical protein